MNWKFIRTIVTAVGYLFGIYCMSEIFGEWLVYKGLEQTTKE